MHEKTRIQTTRSLSNSLIRKMYFQKKLQKFVKVCKRALMTMESSKTPGTDGLTSEFYRFFWNAIGKFMVESFNYAFQHGSLSISQRQGIISLIPKKNKNAEYLTNWRPVSLLNVDYKIATKTIALRLEKILPSVIHPCQSGNLKG